jgi:hypothetical protein
MHSAAAAAPDVLAAAAAAAAAGCKLWEPMTAWHCLQPWPHVLTDQ